MFDISALAQGFALGLGMFVCPGPKDIVILQQALARRPLIELIAAGTLSDVLLIWLGIAGVSLALSRMPMLQSAALCFGIGLMLVHGVVAARRALRGAPGMPALVPGALPASRRKSRVALLAVSLFNPVAWLDTLLVIGTTGASLPRLAQPSFALGASVASLAWFVTLVVGSRMVGTRMGDAKHRRVIDGFVAVAMFAMAIVLARGPG